MKAFIFSGLGADQRVFEHIDFGKIHPIFIPWKAISSHENLATYALKMSSGFPKDEPFILLGISFGGILAQEVAKIYPKARIIILASVQSRKQLPFFMRLSGILKLHHLIPFKQILRLKSANHWFFGCKTEEEKHLLDQILAETDPVFARWAIGEIIQWKQLDPLDTTIFHIHGNSDRIFPIKQVAPTSIIENGSHFMTVSQPKKLSTVLQHAISEIVNSMQ